MGLFSLRCAACEEPSRRPAGRCIGRESGSGSFEITFFDCDNERCLIRQAARRGAREAGAKKPRGGGKAGGG